MHDVFVSYASQDQGAGSAAYQFLKNKGLQSWMAPADLPPALADAMKDPEKDPAELYAVFLRDSFPECRVMVCVLSRAAAQSPRVRQEIERATAKKVPLVPFRVEEGPLGDLENELRPFPGVEAWAGEVEDHLPRLEALVRQLLPAPTINLSIDGQSVQVPPGTTIYDAARKLGIDIPILCHREHMNPVAVCRVCSVEVRWGPKPTDRRDRVLAPACYRPVENGMFVSTHHTSCDVRKAAAMVTELLMSDHPTPCARHAEHHDCELELMAVKFEVAGGRLHGRTLERGRDQSSDVIAVDHAACILCDRCVRGCNDIRNNQVIGRMGKGYQARIAFDLNNTMGDSSCVSCGECMVSCPTGALTHREEVQSHAWDPRGPRPEPISADDLVNHPFFKNGSHKFLSWHAKSVVRRHYKKGDVICHQGEFGSTAFYIEQGRVDIFLESRPQPPRAAPARASPAGCAA